MNPIPYYKGCMNVPLPTVLPPVAGGPGPGWSVIAEYDVGDLTAIETAFGGAACGDSLAWSPDGTKLTLSSGSNTQDLIRTFTCSTPFDPTTASASAIQSRANPSYCHFNASGSKCYASVIVGDEIEQYGASDWVIDNQGGAESDLTKSDTGMTGSTDGAFTIDPTGTILVWKGDEGGARKWKSFTIPGGDLDSFVALGDTGAINSAWVNAQGLSPMTKDNEWIVCLGSQGIAFEGVTDLATMSGATRGANQAVNSLVTFDFRPDVAWLNPNDTREVWLGEEASGGIQLVRFATNVDG